MSKLNNTNNFSNIPKQIREQIKSYIWESEPIKEYDNLSILDFKDKIESHYISKSNKSLKYKVFNLMGMTDKNGSYIYNIKIRGQFTNF